MSGNFNIDDALKAYEHTDHEVKGQEVTIFPTHAEVKMPSGSIKCISIADLTAALSSTLQDEIQSASLLLPANCYYWSQTVKDLKLSCYYPGRIRTIMHVGYDAEDPSKTKKEYEIPFPNIIVSHKLARNGDKWEWKEARYLATSKSISQLPLTFLWAPESKEQLWAIPFTNTYAAGNLCYGSNSLPRQFRDNFRGIDWHFALLYSTPFNDDLGIPSTASGNWVPAKWFKELSKHKVFPYELLKFGKKPIESKSTATNIFNVEIET
jgi:hypothetical protein